MLSLNATKSLMFHAKIVIDITKRRAAFWAVLLFCKKLTVFCINHTRLTAAFA